MTENMTEQFQGASAEGLCGHILQDAEKEASAIIAEAEAQAVAIQGANAAELDVLRRDALAAASYEAGIRERQIMATVNLETRRILMTAREKVFDAIMAGVMQRASDFRHSPDYERYLSDMIIAGALVLDSRDVVVVVSPYDREIVGRAFLDRLERVAKDEYSKVLSLTLAFDEQATDIGVVVRSSDRRMECDNTFGGRLKRMHDTIRTDILKEVFGDNV